MTQAKISSVSSIVQNSDKNAADLDQALAVAGLGWYNIKFCLVFAMFLIAGIVEVIGYSYILPAAKCDLNISDSQRGLIASLPYIAIVITSFPWGYLVDTRGRRPMIIISSVTCGGFGILAAFMPDMISFTVCKFIASLCLACPGAVPYTFIGEILPQRHRDLALSVTNAMQSLGSALVPLLAWGILSSDIRADFKSYDFRSWRLLAIVYSCTFLVASFFMYFGPESPKYLVSQGKHEEALEVLRKIYAGNTGKSPDEFPIQRLVSGDAPKEKLSFLKSLQVQSAPLIKPPYLMWLALNGFLLFGVFATLNGLFMWVPDVLNRVLGGSVEGKTACQVIAQRFDEMPAEGNAQCDDSIDRLTFVINSVANISCAFIALAASVSLKFIGKKALLVLMYFILGVFCILINFITESMLFAVLLSSMQLTAVGIGPINAYAVDIFPTNLRGLAVGLALMLGRIGSVIGTNVAGIMINSVCEATFYTFGCLLLLCGLLTFLLPKSNTNKKKPKITHL